MILFGLEIPRTLQNFARDMVVFVIVAALGYVVDNLAELHISPSWYPLVLAVAMALYRWAREMAGFGPSE